MVTEAGTSIDVKLVAFRNAFSAILVTSVPTDTETMSDIFGISLLYELGIGVLVVACRIRGPIISIDFLAAVRVKIVLASPVVPLGVPGGP